MTTPRPSPEDDPFAVALRQAVRDRGLSLERVRYHLARRGHGVSAATISYWQSGRSRPERATSVAALGDLEAVLEVRPGTLIDALRISKGRPIALPLAQRSTGEQSPTTDPLVRDQHAVAALVAARDKLARQLGADFRDAPTRLSVHVRAQVRSDRSLGRRSIREVVLSSRGGFRRYPIGLYLPGAASEVSIVGDRNCRVAEVARSEEQPEIVVAIVEREGRLGAHEPWLVEYRVEPLGSNAGVRSVFLHLDSRTDLCVFDVQFPRGDYPVALTFTARKCGRDRSASLPVAGERQATAVERVGPGLVGASWWW